MTLHKDQLLHSDFIKAQSLGNDFVILKDVILTKKNIQDISNRWYGVGCDQLLVLYPSAQGFNDGCRVAIWNQDGSQAESCGNGIRCVVALISRLLQEKRSIRLQGPLGELYGWMEEDGINMTVQEKKPSVGYIRRNNVLYQEGKIDLGVKGLSEGIPVHVGNPHLLVFIEDDLIDFNSVGLVLSKHPAFPDGVNVSFVKWIGLNSVKVVVWERGVGLTSSCGSAACAIAAFIFTLDQDSNHCSLEMPGGKTMVSRDAEGNLFHTAPAFISFAGYLDERFFAKG